MSADKLFEAFFWMEPGKADPNGPFTSTRVLLHYPQDVSHIAKEFREIPQYCFPDLERMKLEKAENCRNELLTFTLTDNDGRPLYGVCLRNLFRGISRRHDVRRRPKHALCFVARHPHQQLLRALLLQLYGLGLMEQQPGSVRALLDLLYTSAAARAAAGEAHDELVIARKALPELIHDVRVGAPVHPQALALDAPLASATGGAGPALFLLETLGVDRALVVLSAVLCEKRVIFLADDAASLVAAAAGVLALMHPFQYRHTFVPQLPTPLLAMCTLQTPYILGVRRYQGPLLARERYGDVVVVDLDKGDVILRGNARVKDFVGESGTALKQASESFDRVKQRAMGLFRSPAASSASAAAEEARPDAVAAVLSDLKTALGAKPSANSVSALFRSLPGGAKATVEEERAQWALDTERAARDAMLLLWVYLFADADDFAQQGGRSAGSSSSGAKCDNSALISRRATAGDSRAVQEFLFEFLQTQAWKRFFAATVEARGVAGRSGAVGGWGRAPPAALAAADSFEASCETLRGRRGGGSGGGGAVTLAAARGAIAQRAAAVAGAGDGVGGVNKGLTGPVFHALTVLHITPGDGPSAGSEYDQSTEYKICQEALNTAAFPAILRAVIARLEIARAALAGGARAGSPGVAGGVKALALLRALLVTGPEAALGAAIDLLDALRALLALSTGKPPATPPTSTSAAGGTAAPAESTGSGGVPALRAAVLGVLDLVLDHKRLCLQRRCSLLCRTGAFPHLLLQAPPTPLFSPFAYAKLHKRQSDALRKDYLAPGQGQARQVPAFATLHAALQPPGAVPTDPAAVRCSEPVRASTEDDEEDDEAAASARARPVPAASSSSRAGARAGAGAVVEDLLDTSFDTFQPSAFQPSVPKQGAGAGAAGAAGAADEAAFRVVNQDTGEVLDLRSFYGDLPGATNPLAGRR